MFWSIDLPAVEYRLYFTLTKHFHFYFYLRVEGSAWLPELSRRVRLEGHGGVCGTRAEDVVVGANDEAKVAEAPVVRV